MMLPSSRSLLIALSLLLVSAGCEDSDPVTPPSDLDLQPGHALLAADIDVDLRADADAFQPGAPVTLVLENNSQQVIGFNLCFYVLEFLSDDEWVLLQDPRTCTAHLNLLNPGDGSPYETVFPEHLEPGEYRFRVALYLMDQEGHRDQVSGSFLLGG